MKGQDAFYTSPQTSVITTEVPVTLLYTGWSGNDGNEYVIEDDAIDPDKEIILTYATTIQDGQFEALQKANIRPFDQVTARTLKIKALGTVPTISIPILLIIKETV